MELQDLPQESTSPRNVSLEDSQDLLAETTTNIPYINQKELDIEIPRLLTQKKRKKKKESFISRYINLLSEKINSSTIYNKIFIIIALIIIIITFLIKFILYFIMMISLIKRYNKLRTFIFTRILDDARFKYIYYYINNIFLIIGLIIYFLEMFCQFNIRYKTMLTINECSFKSLILSKCLFFISLGLIPEVIFANIPFKSKQNIFLSFYKMKFLIQPFIIIILIIYVLLTLFIRSEENKKDRIVNGIKLIKEIVNDFVDKNIFVWNEFNEKKIKDEKDKDKDKDKDNKKKEDITRVKDEQLKRGKTIIENNNRKNYGTIIKRKRKESIDENENEDKSKSKTLLEKNGEDDDEKNKMSKYFQKMMIFSSKLKLFLFKIKKFFILGIIGFIIFSPVINGIFGYGYYIFYDSKATLYFQIDLGLCFVFGFILILLTND